MKDSLLIGVAMGVIVGAFLVHSNPKANELVEKGKEELKKQVEKL